jgi:hypothetical protein
MSYEGIRHEEVSGGGIILLCGTVSGMPRGVVRVGDKWFAIHAADPKPQASLVEAIGYAKGVHEFTWRLISLKISLTDCAAQDQERTLGVVQTLCQSQVDWSNEHQSITGQALDELNALLAGVDSERFPEIAQIIHRTIDQLSQEYAANLSPYYDPKMERLEIFQVSCGSRSCETVDRLASAFLTEKGFASDFARSSLFPQGHACPIGARPREGYLFAIHYYEPEDEPKQGGRIVYKGYFRLVRVFDSGMEITIDEGRCGKSHFHGGLSTRTFYGHGSRMPSWSFHCKSNDGWEDPAKE